MIRKISCSYVGGAVGALVDSINVWVLSKLGMLALLGVSMRPDFTPEWLYPRLVWGGLWGLLLVLPFFKNRVLLRGMLMSLAPTAMVLLVMFPGMGKGMLGLGFGLLTPLVVLLLNLIWGMVAALWYRGGTR